VLSSGEPRRRPGSTGGDDDLATAAWILKRRMMKHACPTKLQQPISQVKATAINHVVDPFSAGSHALLVNEYNNIIDMPDRVRVFEK